MDYQEAIREAEIQIDMYESMILYNKDFEPKNDNSNYERKMDFLKTVISAMQELQQYKKLGTLEEVREAVEKQRAKKPKNVETEGYRYTDTYRCPTCGGNFSGTGIADYCYHCGQRLNWE